MIPFDRAAPPALSPSPQSSTPTPQQPSGREAASPDPADGRASR